jgi:hypothetical protein
VHGYLQPAEMVTREGPSEELLCFWEVVVPQDLHGTTDLRGSRQHGMAPTGTRTPGA